MKLKISVIIVTFNNESTIKSCLESVINNSYDLEIIVFDNNSTDKTVSFVEEFKSVGLLKSNINLGFAKANNMAAKKAKGDYLIFLNPDTKIFNRESLNKLVKVLEKNLEYGLVGPKLVYTDGSIQNTVRKLPTLQGAIKEYWLGSKGSYDFYLPKCQNLCEVESVVGACMVINKNVFERIGGWDEKYFLYFEDLQLCVAIKKLGLKIGYAADIVVEHQVGVSGKSQDTSKLSLESSQKFHGKLKFLLIQFISRLGNKLR